jgi:deoxycytidylate deaminase
MSPKFMRKYMRFAKLVGEDQNPCLSRGIGTVIVNPDTNKLLSIGYNGPARGVPHMDTYEALSEFIYPQLTPEDKLYISKCSGPGGCNLENGVVFANQFRGCGTCPRKLVGAASGERLDLCGCVHSEVNACINAGCDLTGAYLFAYCGVPCINCTKEIINFGIKRVYCLREDSGPKDNKYESWRSEWKLAKAGVELVKLSRTWIHQND